MSRVHFGTWMSLAGLLVVAGCGGGDPNRRPTAQTTVTVTHNGSPVEGATVTFISDEQPIETAVGRTDAQGVANMRTYEEDDGAVLGSHKVTIIKSKIADEQPEAAPQESDEYEPPTYGGNPAPVLENQIPSRYGSPGSSGLTAEVTEDGPNEIQFELTD